MNDQADLRPRIGLFGIGLDTYWPQFDGLLARLTGYQQTIAQRLRSCGAELVDVGMVDNPDKARQAASRFRREEVDLIFLYVSTYALSCTVLPVVQEARVPVVVLNLQPVAQLDYEAFNRAGRSGANDRRLAGALPELLPPRNRLRFQPCRDPLPPGQRLPAGCGGVERNRRLGRRRPRGGRHAGKPGWRAGALLLRNARCL